MGAATGCVRFLIVFLNCGFTLVTLLMVTAGFVIKFGSHMLRQFGQSVLDQIKASVEDVFDQHWNADDWDLNDIFGTVATFLIAAGFLLLLLCILGFIASCSRAKSMLLLYASIVGLLLSIQVVMLIVVYASPSALKDPARITLTKSLQDFEGLNATNTNSITWNFVMRYFKCCGATNYEDFRDHSSWWGKTEHVTPYACCTILPTSEQAAYACAGNLTDPDVSITTLDGSYYYMGCVQAIGNFIFVENELFVGLTFGLVFLAQILLSVMSVILTLVKETKVRPCSHDEYSRSRRDAPKLCENCSQPIEIKEVYEVEKTKE